MCVLGHSNPADPRASLAGLTLPAELEPLDPPAPGAARATPAPRAEPATQAPREQTPAQPVVRSGAGTLSVTSDSSSVVDIDGAARWP